MADLTLLTGKHARAWCPVFLPFDAEPGAAYTVAVAGMELPAQGLVRGGQTGICFVLPEAPAGAELALHVSPGAHDEGVTLREVTDGVVEVAVDGERFTAYHFAGEGNRPFLYPVLGPGGINVVRNFPMIQDVPGEPHDHPHQRGIWTANGDVNGFDNWHEGPERARMVHTGFTALESGPVCGRLAETLDWVSAKGDRLCTEEREIRVYRLPQELRLVDWEITLHATDGAVRLGDTKEGGMLSVRVASSMDGARGGTIENGWGGVGEAECWGKPAPWCDYSGVAEGRQVGIAVFDWRENPRFPSTWHVRDYGLMGANIFGQRAFHGGDPAVCGDLVMQAGSSLTFRYRFFIHPGGAVEADVAGRWLDYVFPPQVRVGA